eukprot:scaffold6706_cov83-Phaeocystis_antarctica.AAC.2
MHVTVAACMSQLFNVRPVLINSAACPPTRLPPTARQPWSARRRRRERVQRAGAISGAAALSTRGAAQDDVMTPAGPTDTTSAPSRAPRCACVAGVLSAPERSPRGSARGARLSRPRATALEEGGEEARGAASCSWLPRARGEPPGPRHARRPHCPYRERSKCVSDRFSPMIENDG